MAYRRKSSRGKGSRRRYISVYSRPGKALYRVKTGNVRYNLGVQGPQQYRGVYNFAGMAKRRRGKSRSPRRRSPRTYVSVYSRPGRALYRVKAGNVRHNLGVQGPQQYQGTYNFNAMKALRES